MLDLKSAREKMVNTAFLQTSKYRDQQMRADFVGCHPQIREFERAFINRARKMGIPLFCHCAVRTAKEQNWLYIQGHTKAKAGNSAHNYGMAVDIIHGIMGWDLHDQSWAVLGHIGQEVARQKGIKLRWGGHFKSIYDPAHWELDRWRDHFNDYPEWQAYHAGKKVAEPKLAKDYVNDPQN